MPLHAPQPTPSIPSALTIAGSDSGGGAGIQADLRTFIDLDVHGLSAIAALTAQHTRGVTAVHVPPLAFLRAQIDACFEDFDIRAVKLGMLANTEVIGAVADALEAHRPAYVVLDPVMIATSGARLLEDAAVTALRERLLPLASVVTPNLPEAEVLLGRRIPDRSAMRAAADDLLATGARAVFLKGGHLPRPDQAPDADVPDLYVDANGARETTHPHLAMEAHGTGCTLAAATAAHLCRGLPLADACLAASDYVHAALLRSYAPGRSPIRVPGARGFNRD